MKTLKLAMLGVMLGTTNTYTLTAYALQKNYSDSNQWDSYESGYSRKGVASWYGPGFNGKKTASGETFNMHMLTAAHKTLPLSSYAEVTNLANHRSIVVRINDRGPYHGNRIMDLSYAAAKKLGIHSKGSGTVMIKALTGHHTPTLAVNEEDEGDKNIYLKLGNFPTPQSAKALQSSIAAKHLPTPTIKQANYKKFIYYTMHIGPLKSERNAQQLNHKLERMGIKTTQVVADAK